MVASADHTTARSICASVRSARAVSRSREMPSGTDGGRKQPTASPPARQSAAQRTAASGEGARTETTAASGRTAVSPAAVSRPCSAAATARARAARSGSRRSSRSARQRGAGGGGRESGVEDEGTGRVDQVVDDPGRAEHRAALAAEGLGEGDAWRRRRRAPASPAACGAPRPPSPSTPSPWASSTSRAAPRCAAGLGECGQRGGVAVDREDRVGHGERPRPSWPSERLAHGLRVGVRDDRGRGRGRGGSRRSSEAWLPASETISEPCGGERGDGGEVRRVAGGEDQRRLEAAERRRVRAPVRRAARWCR